jgi:hypothetical protein
VQILRSRRIPRVGSLATAWWHWEKGDPYYIRKEVWIDEMIRDGHLPTRAQVTYEGRTTAEAEERVQGGSHVIVEMLDTPPVKRRRTVMLGDNVLVATREGWDASR